jgi:hypothetical protein
MACAAFGSFASDHITASSYWQDDSAQATFEQAQHQTYTTYEGVLSLGYTSSAIWIRLNIVPPVGADKLVLRIRPVYLDDITLFSRHD